MPARRKFLLRSNKLCLFSFIIAWAIFLFWPRVVFATRTVVINSFKNPLIDEEQFDVGVNIEGFTDGEAIYFKGAFVATDSTNYFGYTLKNGEWIENSEAATAQFKAIIGVWNQTLTVKPDLSDTGFKGTGSYNFKVGFYYTATTGNLSSVNWSNTVSIIITESSPSPTPSPTPTPTPSQTSNVYPIGIILSEFMPNPEDEDEWVEIKNTSSSEAVLIDWKIDDIADGGSSPKKFSATVTAGGYYKIDVGDGFLNNSGDEVRLLYPNESLADKTSYSYSNKGTSWIKTDAVWCEAENPTPGSANSSCRSQSDTDSSGSTSSPTPSPSPSPSPRLTPSPSPKPTKTPEATLSGEILGEESSPAGFYPWEATEEGRAQENTSLLRNKFIPKLFLSLGLVFLFASAFWIWYNFLKERQE